MRLQSVSARQTTSLCCWKPPDQHLREQNLHIVGWNSPSRGLAKTVTFISIFRNALKGKELERLVPQWNETLGNKEQNMKTDRKQIKLTVHTSSWRSLLRRKIHYCPNSNDLAPKWARPKSMRTPALKWVLSLGHWPTDATGHPFQWDL